MPLLSCIFISFSLKYACLKQYSRVLPKFQSSFNYLESTKPEKKQRNEVYSESYKYTSGVLHSTYYLVT